MSIKTYHGSCHCGAVRFEADIDFSTQETGKCNCTSCRKRRWWSASVKPEAFRAISGEELLSRNRGGLPSTSFCTVCGVIPFARVAAAEWNDGAKVSINVACLDEVEAPEVISARVHYYDGLHDNWWETPAETRHL